MRDYNDQIFPSLESSTFILYLKERACTDGFDKEKPTFNCITFLIMHQEDLKQECTEHTRTRGQFHKSWAHGQIIEIALLKLVAQRKSHSAPLRSFSKVGRRAQNSL